MKYIGNRAIYKLVKGVSISWIRFILTIIIALIQTPLLFENLSTKDLDFWYIFFSLGAFVQLADFGLVQTISRLIIFRNNSKLKYELDDIGKSTKYNSYTTKQIYYNSIFSFSLILLVLCLLGIACFHFFYNKSVVEGKLTLVFAVFMSGIFFNLISNIPTAMLIGHLDIVSDSFVKILLQLLYFFLIYFLLPHFKSLLTISLLFLLQNALQAIILHYVFSTKNSKVFLTEKQSFLLNIKLIKDIYSQSSPLFVNQFGGWLTGQGTVLILSLIVGSSMVSNYAINQQIFTYIAAVSLIINQSIGPFIAKKYAEGNIAYLRKLFLDIMLVSLYICGTMLMTEILCANEIMSIWVGPGHFIGDHVVLVFSLIVFFEIQHSVAGNFVWNTGTWPFNKWTLFAGILTISFGYLLGKQYGIIGFVYAILLSKIVTLNWYVVYYNIKNLEIPLKKYISKFFMPLGISLVIAYFLGSLIKSNLMNTIKNEYFVIILVYICCSSIFLMMLFITLKKNISSLYNIVKSSILDFK